MTFMQRLFAPRIRAAVDPFDDRYYTAPYSGRALTGVWVSAETALSVAAVWACVRVISDPLGWLPLQMYKRQADGGRQRADWHPLHGLLHDQPNRWQTAQDWRRQMTVHALLRGNGFSRILPGPRGFADQLVPIHPDRLVEIRQQDDGSLIYEFRKPDGVGSESLIQDEVFHLRGLSMDGIRGMGVIEYARQTVGLGLATEQYAARFFSQNATPAALLVHPGKLSSDGRRKIKSEWEADMAGLPNAHRTAVVAEGVDYKPISVTNEDSQFLQTRQFGVEEVARWFGVPLHKIQSTTKETSWGSGIEEMNLSFTTDTLMPWARVWEQAIARDLILDTRNYYAEFQFDALARGRLLDRYQAFHLALTDGWMSRNEVRAIENRNRIDGLDEFLAQANMQSARPEPEAETEPEPDSTGDATPDEKHGQNDAHYKLLLEEAAGRIVRKEIMALTKAAKRAAGDAEAWEREVREFYGAHAQFVVQSLRMRLPKAQQYVEAQQNAALTFGVDGLIADEEFAVTLLCELATEGNHGTL